MKKILALLIVVLAGCDKPERQNIAQPEHRVNFADGSFVIARSVSPYTGYVYVIYPDGRAAAYPWRMIGSIDYGK